MLPMKLNLMALDPCSNAMVRATNQTTDQVVYPLHQYCWVLKSKPNFLSVLHFFSSCVPSPNLHRGEVGIHCFFPSTSLHTNICCYRPSSVYTIMSSTNFSLYRSNISKRRRSLESITLPSIHGDLQDDGDSEQVDTPAAARTFKSLCKQISSVSFCALADRYL
jgi:hypothetical protein